jgi:hypothetical protein
VSNEIHPLVVVPGKTNRIFVPTFGGFYTETFELRDANGVPLVPGTDYDCTFHYDTLSRMTGKEVMALVVITRASVPSPVSCNYNAVGGFFSPSVFELQAVMDKLALDELHFTWEGIVGKPEAYPAAPHADEYWQLYGLDTTVTELQRIADSCAVGMTPVIEASVDYYQLYLAEAQALLDDYKLAVSAHVNDFNNPHETTALKLQLEQLNNWRMANNAETFTQADNLYLPIGGVFNQLAAQAAALDAHVKNKANPHGTTAALVGIPLKTAVDTKFGLRQKWSDPASSTLLLGGQSYVTAFNASRFNIPADAVISGRFPMSRLAAGAGVGDPNYVLVGTNQCRHVYNDLMASLRQNAQGLVFTGQHASIDAMHVFLNTHMMNLSSYPVMSVAVGNCYQPVNSWRGIYTLITFLRGPGGWQLWYYLA